MPVADVTRAATQRAADGSFTKADVDATLASAGGIKPDEEAELARLKAKYEQDGILDPQASSHFAKVLGEIPKYRARAERHNRTVEQAEPRLRAELTAMLAPGAQTRSYGGSPIPAAVKTLVTQALADGVLLYDVRELKPNPVYDTSHGEPHLTLDGEFNPYAQEQQATDTLAFSYSELTPEKIAEDMATSRELPVGRATRGTDGKSKIEVTRKTLQPNGSIRANYDEVRWPDTQARGPGGEKYASNFAILGDGSFHAVPWSRRTSGEPSRILTTASLARGKPMLFNGHLNMTGGVVTYVGLSGRLANLREEGETFIDPIALLKAWGFQVRPGLTVTYE